MASATAALLVVAVLSAMSATTSAATTSTSRVPVAAPPGPAANATALRSAIAAAVRRGDPEFTIPPGDYPFNSGSLVVKDATNFALHATGVTLWFTIHGTAFQVLNGVNVSVTGITIDYNPLPFAQGRVTAVSTNNFTAQFDPAYVMPDKTLNPYFNASVVKAIFWDAHTWLQLPGQGQQFFADSQPLGNHTYVVTTPTAVHTATPGSLVTIGPRVGTTYLLTNCSGTTTSHVTLHAGSNMGFVEQGGGGASVWHNVSIRRRPPVGSALPPLLAMNADGFHSSCTERGPHLLNSSISHIGDDMVNVHNKMTVLFRVTSPTNVIILDPDDANTMTRVRPGDALSFFALNALHLLAGGVRVAYAARVTNASIIAAGAAALNTINAPPYSAHILPRVWTSMTPWAVQLAQPLPAAVVPFSLAQVDRITARDAVVAGCTFDDGHARLAVVKGVGMQVRGCRMGNAQAGVKVMSEQSWLEGDLGLRNEAVVGNTLFTNSSIYVAPYAVNVTVANNTV